MRRLLLIAAAVAALALPASAAAGSGLLLGIDDDMGKWAADSPVASAVTDLGARAQRITVVWLPGEPDISGIEALDVQRAIDRAPGVRTVLAVYGHRPADAPQTPAARTEFCAFVRSLLVRFPAVRDVVIGNEVNRAEFWSPQRGAPAAYEGLLARCWDMLHAFRPGVNVIASTATRPDAGSFIRGLGQAYRASRRTAPFVDTFGHNPYPTNAAERPWARHPGGDSIGEGDYQDLMQAYYDAFAGTRQPLPGQGSTTIWYLEDGFQTAVDPGEHGAYQGAETDRAALSPSGQAGQLADAVRLAYCEPAVGAFFNFLLVDEHDLGGWQSGLLWAGGDRKPAYDAFRQVAAEAAAGSIDCAHLPGGPAPSFQPASGVAVGSVDWSLQHLRILTGEPALYEAVLVDAQSGRAVAGVSGSLPRGVASVVRFPAAQLAPGSYRIRLRLSALVGARQTTLVSGSFRVAPRPVFTVVR